MIPKIAIKGHPDRGKEVIQILESLGGKNNIPLKGDSIASYYYIDYNDNNRIYCHSITYVNKYCKKYTLEEFKEKFPFKIGDKVRDVSDNEIGIILGFIDIDGELMYVVNFKKSGHTNMPAEELKHYKEIKEERNITLTLEKAKTYYEKGGELKELALQAFNEKELNPLPKTWKEFCDNYPIKESEAMITCDAKIIDCSGIQGKREYVFKDIMPSEKSAKAHLALMQLEQLRDCYRQGDIPNFTNDEVKYCIIKDNKGIHIVHAYHVNYFLSFTKREVAEEFLTNFEPLIKIADDYI